MRYCNACQRMVRPVKYFSWPAFLLLCFTVFGGVVYLIYYLFKRPECPICRGKDFTREAPSAEPTAT